VMVFRAVACRGPLPGSRRRPGGDLIGCWTHPPSVALTRLCAITELVDDGIDHPGSEALVLKGRTVAQDPLARWAVGGRSTLGRLPPRRP
jgi:hypothetical protein